MGNHGFHGLNGLGSGKETFEGEGCVFEVEQEADLEIGDFEVAKDLGGVGIVESFSDFGIHYDGVFHDKIRDGCADESAFVVNRKTGLLLEEYTSFGKFDAESVFVEFFIETIAKFTMNRHRCSDDLLCQFFVWCFDLH